MSDDFFADFDEEVTSQAVAKPQVAPSDRKPSNRQGGQQNRQSGGFAGGNRSYPDELHSEKIIAEHRTFFIDLKSSNNGKFVKISEKSRGGKRSTIMMDAEDVPDFIKALQKVQEVIEKG